MAASSKPDPFNPSPRVLLGPGPSDVPPRVLAAMGYPLLGHLDPEFVALMDETQGLLRQVFRTENRLTMAVSGTGSAGMEAVVVNLIEPGDTMLVCVNGVFGGRMADVAERAGAKVTTIERPYGEVFDPEEVRAAVKKAGPKVVGIVHAETSTGAWQPVEEIAQIAHDVGALIALDTVTSLGGIPVEIDAWGIDAAFSCSQKCLRAAPARPGPGHLQAPARPRSSRAERRSPGAGIWICRCSKKYWGRLTSFYHHTAPIKHELPPSAKAWRAGRRGGRWTPATPAIGSTPRPFRRASPRWGSATRPPKATGSRNSTASSSPTASTTWQPSASGLLADWGIEIGGGLGQQFKGQGVADRPDRLRLPPAQCSLSSSAPSRDLPPRSGHPTPTRRGARSGVGRLLRAKSE